ncbi:MAG: alanine--tRNA ligase [Candidatus Sabulitectum sp.]|nr:alanine--tRNA ligase [Candidatus Sabulitectum sp.]
MTERELVDLYIKFFESKDHKRIPGASIIPENDSTILFTPAGMQPLVPFLLGEKHPQGKRLVDVQKCIRTGDIEEVGDATHLTFFRMLGNWSLGDYFKREAILWSWEFLTGKEWLGFDPERISVTVFAGEGDIPADKESEKIWLEAGVPAERIYSFGMKDNWWGPTGATGPCGPDTEMFYDTGKEPCGEDCTPGCSCGKYFEVWNDVFMEYGKTEAGTYEPLTLKSVDTGMGVERTVAMLAGCKTVYEIGVLKPLIRKIRKLAGIEDEEPTRSERVITDHIRSATHILGDDQGVVPSNVDQGYVLRRLIRLAIRHGMKLEIEKGFLGELAAMVIEIEGQDYPELLRNRSAVMDELEREEKLFGETLQAGMKQFNKMLPNLLKNPNKVIAGRLAFKLYDTFGFPVELTADLANENGMTVDMDGYHKAFDKHRELSRQGAEKKFKGGLADNSEMVTKLHTATHLLHAALRKVLGDSVKQKGSNITAERLRFDFLYPEKMTDEQKKEVEALVNSAINDKISIEMKEMHPDEAEKLGALGFFKDKYGDVVKVYTIGKYSTEICGGPHVQNTSELGRFRIASEKSSSRGIRRIKAVVE